MNNTKFSDLLEDYLTKRAWAMHSRDPELSRYYPDMEERQEITLLAKDKLDQFFVTLGDTNE